jgi:hypothetical protein
MGCDFKRRLIIVSCVIQFIVLCLHFSLDTGEWRFAVHMLKIFFQTRVFLLRERYIC